MFKKSLFVFLLIIIVISFKSKAAAQDVYIKNDANISIPNAVEDVKQTVYCNDMFYGSKLYKGRFHRTFNEEVII